MKTFRSELTELINKYSLENGNDTPDFIVAEYLQRCLENFDITLQQRQQWYGKPIGKTFFRANEITAESHEHVFDDDGGSCRNCGKTVIDLLSEEPEERTKDELS